MKLFYFLIFLILVGGVLASKPTMSYRFSDSFKLCTVEAAFGEEESGFKGELSEYRSFIEGLDKSTKTSEYKAFCDRFNDKSKCLECTKEQIKIYQQVEKKEQQDKIREQEQFKENILWSLIPLTIAILSVFGYRKLKNYESSARILKDFLLILMGGVIVISITWSLSFYHPILGFLGFFISLFSFPMIKLIKWKPKHTIWKVIVIVIAILLSLLLIFFTSFLFVSIESTRGLI